MVYILWWVLQLQLEVPTVQFLTKCHFSWYSAHVLCSTIMFIIAFVFSNLGTSKVRIRAMYLQYQITAPPQIFSTLYWEQVPENGRNKMFSDTKYWNQDEDILWSYKILPQTKQTKKHRTIEEEMEGPTSSWGSRNRLTCLTLQEHDDDDKILPCVVLCYEVWLWCGRSSTGTPTLHKPWLHVNLTINYT